MELQHGPERDDAAPATRMDAAGGDAPGGEVRRMRITDPDAWHDLAERGTPRNG